MRIEEGNSITLKCNGTINESKCQFKENALNLQHTQVSKKRESVIWIKNLLRNPTVFQISHLPPHVEILPMKGKIGGEDSLPLNVTYYSDNEEKISDKIILDLRGGKSLRFFILYYISFL